MEKEEAIQLGGNIELIGFNTLEKAKLVVLKKIIGNYARKLSEINKFEKLSVKMLQKENNYNINAELKSDKPQTSEATDKNLFIAIDSALKNLV